MAAHLFLNPGLTLKKGLPSFLTTLLGSDLKCTSARKKTSNTECVFSPPPGFLNTLTLPLTSLTTSTLSVQKKDSEKKRRTREDGEYAKCSETVIIKVKGGFVTFTNHFKYLGS